MEKFYYTIGEVAELLGESTSLVRFWTNSFPSLLKPTRNAKGNRLYKEGEVELLRQIHHLVKDKGFTLDGARAQITASRASVAGTVRAIETLKAIRSQLVEIKENI